MSNPPKLNASVLGLQGVLDKKKARRDLDELAGQDMASGVEYPTPASAPVSESAPVRLSTDINTPVGLTAAVGKLRLPDGTMVRYESRLIAGDDLKRVTIFKDNQRYESNPDITTLRIKIAKTGGNVMPVTARVLPDSTIEVIAGSRRTKAVIAEELALLANVIIEPVSEVNAVALAYVENDERSDPDVLDDAAYFSKTFDAYKKAGLVATIEEFGKIFSMSKVNMGRYLNVATLPSWLFELCPRTQRDLQGKDKPTWSLRKAEELYMFYSEHGSRIDSEMKSQISLHQCKAPDEIIRVLKKALDKPLSTSLKTSLTSGGKDVGFFEAGKRKKTLKIFLSENAPENVVNEIKRLLESLNN